MEKINIVIPMAGAGSRFAKAGYKDPKPFIDVDGKPMIVRVMENLAYPGARYVLISRQEHHENYADVIADIEKKYNAVFLPIERLTEGAACTVLFAHREIDTTIPVVIANSDQIVDVSFSDYVDQCLERKWDGSIMTFLDPEKSDKWSFAKLDDDGFVTEVCEKVPISDVATVGIYMFACGMDFVRSALDMIIRNDRVNNEFYVCPVYNYLVKEGKKVGIFSIDYQNMHGIGTPIDLQKYVSKMQQKKVTANGGI